MKTTYRHSIFTVVCFMLFVGFSISTVKAQHSLYFTNQWKANSYNPAMHSENDWYVALPLLGYESVTLHTSGFSWKDLVNQDPNSPDSLRLDFAGFLQKLKDYNHLDLTWDATLIGFGMKLNKKSYITFDIGVTVDGSMGFSKSLFDFIANGTNMSDKDIDLIDGKLVTGMVYTTTALGYSREINDKLTVGGKIKVYSGLLDINTNSSTINMDVNDGKIKAYSNLDFSVSTIFGSFSQNSSLWDDGDIKFNDDVNIGGMFKNLGLGFDVGAVYKINKDMQVSVSIVDIGRIKWSSNVNNIRTQNPNKPITFSGLSTTYDNIGDDLGNYVNDLIDSLQRALDLEVKEGKSYSTAIPMKVYLGYSWNFHEGFSLDALYRAKFINSGMENLLMLEASYKYKYLQVSLSNTISNKFFNPGIYLGIGNFFIGMNYSSSLNLAKTTHLSAFGGFSIGISGKKAKENKED